MDKTQKRCFIDHRQTTPTIEEINNLKRTASLRSYVIVIVVGSNKVISAKEFEQCQRRDPGVYMHHE
jgi:hypothetical protein